MRIFYEIDNDACVESINDTFKYYDNVDVAWKHKLNRIIENDNMRRKKLYEINKKYNYSFKYYMKYGNHYIREYIYENCILVQKEDGTFTMCHTFEEYDTYLKLIDDEIKELYY